MEPPEFRTWNLFSFEEFEVETLTEHKRNECSENYLLVMATAVGIDVVQYERMTLNIAPSAATTVIHANHSQNPVDML
jgi:hypothetical protein